MTKKRIGIYLLISFGLVWGVMLPFFALGGEYQSAETEFILCFSMLCPALATVITRKLTKEGLAVTGKDSMMLGISLKDKKWKWFVMAAVLPIIYWDLGEMLYYVIFPKAFHPSAWDTLGIPKNLLFLVVVSGLTNALLISYGALGEEIGWRGYLYPKLEELYGTKKAVIFGGIIWGVWHYPAIWAGHNFGKGYIGEPWSGFFVFTLYTIAAGTILYYLSKKTGSVWAAAFMHAANNTFSGSTVLGLAYSDEELTGIALQSPVRLLIASIPVMIISGFMYRKLKKMEDKS